MGPDLSPSEIQLVLRSSTVYAKSPETSPEQIQATWERIAECLGGNLDLEAERIAVLWRELVSEVPRGENGHMRTDRQSITNIMQIDAYQELAESTLRLLDIYLRYHFDFEHHLNWLGSRSAERLLTHGGWDLLLVRYILRTAAFYEENPHMTHLVGKRFVGLVILQTILYAGEIIWRRIVYSILIIGYEEFDRMLTELEQADTFKLPLGEQRTCAATWILMYDILGKASHDEPDTALLLRELHMLESLVRYSPYLHRDLVSFGKSVLDVVRLLLEADRLAELRDRDPQDVATFRFIRDYQQVDDPKLHSDGLAGILWLVWKDVDKLIREHQERLRFGYEALAELAREVIEEAALAYRDDDFARVSPKEFLVERVRDRLSLRHQIQTYLRNYHTSGRDAVPPTIARDIERALDHLKSKRPKLHKLIHLHYIEEPGLPVEGIAARIGLKGTSRSIAYEFLKLAISRLVEKVQELRREEEANQR